MNYDNKKAISNHENKAEAPNDVSSNLSDIDTLSQYLKSSAGVRQGRTIPPLESWHPDHVADMDLIIKANGEWWHEGGKMTRESLVSLFATILWKEENNGRTEYFLKTPVQKIRIQVEDAPLLINDVGIVNEGGYSWLEFLTTTGDVVRLDDEHPIILKAYNPKDSSMIDYAITDTDVDSHQEAVIEPQVRPYMLVRNGLTALIGRNTFYHLAEIGELIEQNSETILILKSGGKSYQLSMPIN
ncbi:MAG: DUF1285 domain-containing protein [Psychrobacter sp.]|uniref:DUF1285 domain-containing protein n=1 Tax=unclassified Psychrobacter TaxID=196806 RepID=UPI001787D23D|nr:MULTISPECIES: DUF1285 domain-containing protein [unclassified Psychrobacter]MBE0442601.1 DUF1285 domain-containing protein [Psychrobacter sp. FME13]